MKNITAGDIEKLMYEIAPQSLAEEYDNTGLILGSKVSKVSGVLVCLDATLEVLKEAESLGCNLVLSHHPPIFKALSKITTDGEKGGIVEYSMKKDISIISAHTNLDYAPQGLNFYLAKRLRGKDISAAFCGALFTIDEMNLIEFALTVKDELQDKSIKVAGDLNKTIRKVFVLCGAGGRDEEAYDFARQNADVFLSAEFKHSLMVSALADKFSLVEFSHYHSEIVCLDVLYDAVKSAFGEIKVFKSKQKCPFDLVEVL